MIKNSENNFKFKKGDKVIKPKGYRYPGVVVSAFHTTRGEERYVVECTAVGAEGMLHIYNGGQLALDKGHLLIGGLFSGEYRMVDNTTIPMQVEHPRFGVTNYIPKVNKFGAIVFVEEELFAVLEDLGYG